MEAVTTDLNRQIHNPLVIASVRLLGMVLLVLTAKLVTHSDHHRDILKNSIKVLHDMTQSGFLGDLGARADVASGTRLRFWPGGLTTWCGNLQLLSRDKGGRAELRKSTRCRADQSPFPAGGVHNTLDTIVHYRGWQGRRGREHMTLSNFSAWCSAGEGSHFLREEEQQHQKLPEIQEVRYAIGFI